MARALGEVPIERVVVPPFVFLAELAAHEQQLLAGVAEHEAVIGAQIGEALPFVAGHAAKDRALAVHDLVMGERQNEILGKSVMQAEQDLTVMMLAVDRVLADVFERVVHPSHVPLVAEAQPAPFDRLRYHRPGRQFLRRRGRVGKAREHLRIDAPEQVDGVEVLPAAIFVRDPAALRPAVIEIDHRSDGIDAQPVDAIAVEPEQTVGEEEIGDLGAPVIVDQRVPIEMASLHRIGMLVQRRSVELTEPVRVIGEMSGHPIENDAPDRRGGRHRPRRQSRPACRTGWSEQTAPWADNPRIRRTDAR